MAAARSVFEQDMPPIDARAVRGFTVIVYGPPQPKQRARKGAKGRWYTPSETASFERSVALAASVEIAKRNRFEQYPWPRDAYYRLTVHAWFGDARRKDADNVAKAVADALNEIAWHDDSQAIDMIARRRIDRENPRTEIRIEVIA